MMRPIPVRLALAGLGLLVALALVFHVTIGGSLTLSLGEVWHTMLTGPQGGETVAHTVVWSIRLPRAAAAALIGGLLGVVGASFQALFRNPLAEPYVIGVSSGAALGGSVALLFGWSGAMLGLAMPLAAVLGGAGALLLTLALTKATGGIQSEYLLVGGVVVGSLLSALMSLVLALAGQDAGVVLRWMLGSITPMNWERVALLVGTFSIGAPFVMAQARRLNAVAAGEFMAERSGVRLSQLRILVLACGTIMAAVSVGVSGVIPFVGLAAPHLARLLLGVDLRKNGWAASLIGSILLVCADLMAQRIRPGTELPVGAVTAVLGAPLLLWLLKSGAERRA